MARFEFRDATAVVTGATGGIGLAIAEELIDEGCRVIGVGRREDQLRAIEDWHNDAFIPVAADLAKPSSIDQIADAVERHFGGELKLLVNNAGVGAIGPFAEADSDRMRTVFEINFFAAAELSRRLYPALRMSAPSTLCNIGSVLGHTAVPDKSEYCASKFALHGWNDSIRTEWAGDNIRVTMVSPSTTRSGFFSALVGTAPGTKSKSLGSWSPQEVAAASVKAIRHGRREVILSAGGKALVYADRLVPDVVSWLLRR